MEVLLFLGLIGFIVFLITKSGKSNDRVISDHDRLIRQRNKPESSKQVRLKRTPPKQLVLRGKAYVTDGDGLRIAKQELRLFGIDAPEFNHPWGKKAKWHLVSLCKGQEIEATIVDCDHFDRSVAICRLSDGRDLSEEMVKAGLALDWPKFSNGVYRHSEPAGVRKKLWLVDARQKGRMHVWDAYEAKQQQNSS